MALLWPKCQNPGGPPTPRRKRRSEWLKAKYERSYIDGKVVTFAWPPEIGRAAGLGVEFAPDQFSSRRRSM